MEYLIGAGLMACFFVCVLVGYYLGAQRAKPKPNTKPLDLDEKHRLERLQKEFNEVMSYSLEQATGKKVNK